MVVRFVGLPEGVCAEANIPLGDSGYLLRGCSTADGLPENSATAIAQTRDGYLWVGTWNGLARFDGDRFKVLNPANTPQLPDAGIVNLHTDKHDRLWVSTLSGLVVREGAEWRALGTRDGWVGNHVRSFAESSNGDLLMTTFDGHILRFENDRFTQLPAPPGEPGHGYLGAADQSGRWWLVQNRFVGYWDGRHWVQAHTPDPSLDRSRVAITSAHSGGVWILLGTELLEFRAGNDVFRAALPMLQGGIWSMHEDRRTNLWICSYDSGLFQWSAAGDLRHWTEDDGLETLSIRSIFEDRERNLWIASNGGGLQRLTPRRFWTIDTTGGLRTRNPARSVAVAGDGGLWIAFYDVGLHRHDETGTVRVLVPGPSVSESAYGLSVLEDRAGRLWHGDTDSCWWRHGQGPFERAPLGLPAGADIRALFEDSQGRIWIGSRLGAVVYDDDEFERVGPEQGLPSGEIICFGEDSLGAIWIAQPEGVYRHQNGRFTPLRSIHGQPLAGVLCFKAEPNGTMWMGTRAGQLVRWQGGRMDWIGREHGLPECEIRGFVLDPLGYLWMPSNRGVLRASLEQLHAVANRARARLAVQLFDQHDGLPSTECSAAQPNCTSDSLGRLWFATQRGVAVVDPVEFHLNTQPPGVHLEQLTYHLAGAELSDTENAVPLAPPIPTPLRLPAGAHTLILEFAALSFVAPEKVQIEYLLEGYTPQWRSSSTSRRVSFHRLPPGQYVFRVRAANNDGIWNEDGASLAFSMLPFFWQTQWFRFGTGILLVALGGGTVWLWSYRRMIHALERDRSARALHASQARLEAGSDLAGLGYYEVDYGAGTCFLDDRFRQICGVPAEVRLGLEPVAFWLEHVHPDERQRLLDQRRELHEGRIGQVSIEYRYLHPLDGQRWIHHLARRAERPADDRGVRSFGVIRDITEQKRITESLAEDLRFVTLTADLSSRFVNLPAGEVDREILNAERRICEVFDLDVVAFWQWFDEGQGHFKLTHYWSPEGGPHLAEHSNALDHFPWYQEQMRAGRIVAISSPDDLPPEAARDREGCRQLGIKSNLSLPLSVGRAPAVGVLGLNTSRSGRLWPDSFVRRMQLIGQILANALARKRGELALRESEKINRATFEQAAVGMAHVGADGCWLRVNDKLCAILGYTREQLLRLTFQDTLHADDTEPNLSCVRRILSGEMTTYSTETRCVRKDRAVVWVNLALSLVRTEEGEPKHFIAVAEDITERKQAELEMQRLRLQIWHADRVAQTGAITASLAHEMNQPLTGILSTAQAGLRFLTSGNADEVIVREVLTDIVRDTKRAGAVINGLRAMLRRKETQREVVSLAETIREILDLLHSELVSRQAGHSLHVESDAEVLADKTQIQQVLLNLVMNALEAMQNQPPEQRRVELTLGRSTPGEATVTVRDFGPGIPPEDQDKLFTAFSTTKRQGMGIGLPISYAIIESHGGRLSWVNHPEGGAAFCFTLPLTRDEGRGAGGEGQGAMEGGGK